jgi:hypothetical protein
MKNVVIDGCFSCTYDRTTMVSWLNSWQGVETFLNVSVLEGSKYPINILTLQDEITTTSLNIQHQSPSDTIPCPRRMETFNALQRKPTTWTDFSLLQSIQTGSGASFFRSTETGA